MRYISRFKNSIRASSVYGLAFMLTFALAAGLTTYEEAAAQSSITLSADLDTDPANGNQTEIQEGGNAVTVTVTATLDGAMQSEAINVLAKIAPIDTTRYTVPANGDTTTIVIQANSPSGTGTFQITPVNDGVYNRDLTINITGTTDPARFVAATSVTLLDNDQDITLSFAEYDGSDPSTNPASLVTSAAVAEMAADNEDQEVVLWVRAADAPRNAMDVPITVSRNNSRYSVTGDLSVEISAGDNLGKTTLKITPVDNDRYDADAKITVSVGGGLEARPVTITVRDMDETKPTLKVEASPDKIYESGADTQIVQVTATLDGDAVQTSTKVTLAVTDASDDDRYSVTGTKSITIPAGGKTGTTNLAFAPTKDRIFYDDLPITITGSSDYDPDPKASATVTLQDNDQEVTLAVSPDTVMETDVAADQAQKVTITATLPTSRPRDFSVPLVIATSVDNGTVLALDPADGLTAITIDAGKTSGTAEITITPTDNENYNKDADIMVSVADETDQRDNAGLSARPVAIKLTDNEAKPKLEIALGATQLPENGNTGTNPVTINVVGTLKGAPPAIGDDTVVNLTVTPADPDSTRYYLTNQDTDYSIDISGGGSIDSNSNRDLNFVVINDGKFFQDLVLTITAKADGYDTVTKTVTILDDDQDVTLSFLEYDPSDQATLDTEANVSEGDGDEVGQEVVVHAYVAEAPRNAMDVPIQVSRNNARYSVTGDMTIEITAGDNLGKTTLTFTPVENDRFDDPEDITISVGGGLNARNIKVVLSDNDETKPTLKVKASPDKVNEDGADTQVVQVTAELDGDAVQKATTITFKVEPENADRYSVTGTKEITIAAGSKTASTNLAFVPVKDGIFNEDLDIMVTGSSDPDYGTSIATVMLRDDDQEVILSVSPESVTETDDEDAAAQKVTITATLPISTPKEIMIPLMVSTNTSRFALGADDETPTITIKAGDTSGTAEITITTTDNVQFNADEDITVSVTEASGLAARSVAINLTDDEEKPVLEIALDEETIFESEGSGQNVVVTATLKGAPLAGNENTSVKIDVTPADPDANRYTVTVPGDSTITINSGGQTEDPDGTLTLDFEVTQDGKFFADKALTISASATGFDKVTKTVTIQDDDQDITLSFAEYGPDVTPAQETPVTSATVSEADGDEEAQEVVVWARAMEAPRNAMDVPISVTRNSARYSITGDMTIEIGAGDLFGKTTLKITPVENDRFDEPEDIVVSVGGGLNARDIKISVTDLDEKRPTLKVEASPKQINEDGADTQVVQVTATLDGDAVQKATTVTFEVKPDSESRFGVTGDLEVMIPAGSKTASTDLSFVPVKDGIFNQDLAITITGKADPDYNPDPAASETITLRDDDQEITLSVSPATVTEADGDDAEQKVKITATMDNRPARDFLIPLTIADGDRHNVSATEDTITIEAGNTSGSTEITITTIDNDVYDADENITVMVDATSNLAARPVDIKYVDDEKKPVLELALSADTVSESEGDAVDNEITATATLKGPSLAAGVTTTVTFKLEPADADSVRYHLGGSQENTRTADIQPNAGTDSNIESAFDINVTQDGKFFQDKVLTITASADGFDSVSKTVTILDDDQDVTLSFAEFDPQGSPAEPTTAATVMEMDGEEEAQEVVVWVRAMEAPNRSMDVPISVTRNNARYSVSGDMTIEIAADEFLGKTTLKITPVENDLFDDDEKITVSVGGGLNARDITVTLQDADETKPTLAVSATPGTVTEGNGDQVVTVTAKLDGDAVQKATTVSLTVEEENADRYSVTGTMEISIPSGSKSGTTDLTFTPVDDVVFFDDLELTVEGKSDPDYGTNTATVTIADNDQEIMLSADPTYIIETGGDDQEVTITARVTGTPPKQDMEIPLTITENSARYTIATDATPIITIEAGARSGEVTRSFAVTDNDAFDGSIDIPIGISTTSPLTARSINIRLIDDEETHVMLATDVSEVDEAGAMAQDVVVTATLTGKLPTETTVTLSKSGTATKGVDYEVAGEGTISIAAGETEGSTTLSITPADDLRFEDGETIVIGGSAGNLRVTSASLTVIDNNEVPLASVMVDVETIGEGDEMPTTMVITAMLGGTSGEDITIGLSKPGTAVPGEDFSISLPVDPPPAFEIAAGDTMAMKTVIITPIDDMVYEGEEILKVMTVAQLDGNDVGEPVIAQIPFTDNDPVPSVMLAVEPMTIAEGEEVEFTITATASGMASMPITIELDKSAGTAKPGDDFELTGATEGEFQVPAMELSGTKMVTLMAHADMLYEGDEVINVGGTASVLDAEPEVTGAEIALTDGDMVPTIAISIDPAAVEENGGPQPVTITASATVASAIDISLNLIPLPDHSTATLADGGVTDPSVFATPLVIAAGETETSVMVTVVPVDDDIYEGTEHFAFAGMVDGMPTAPATLAINDDEMMPMVALSTDVSEVTEHGGSQDVVVTATLTGVSSMDISVVLTKSGSAVKGEDYDVTAGEGTITVAAGDLTGSTTLSILGIDDHFYEGNEIIEIGGTAGEMMAEVTMLTLVDDESLPTVTLSVVPDMIDEGGGPQVGVITATLSGLSALDLHVVLVPLVDQSSVTLIGPGADLGIAELATSPTVSITVPAKMQSGSINLTVIPVDDDLYETNEYAVFAGNLMGTISAPVVITLVDNDAPAIALSANPTTLREDGGTQSVTFDVEMSGIPVPIPTVITLAKGGTATKGTDYTPSGNAEITIAPGMMTGSTTLGFAVVDDDVYEPSNETIVVSAHWGDSELDDVTLTIIDNFPAPAVTSAIPDMVMEAGNSHQADLSGNFSGKVLTFSASSSSSNVSADVSGSSLTITANRKGAANVTVTATNAAGTASFDVGVTVTAIAAERMVYTDILAAMGRGIMSSVSNTIGGRFSVTASERQIAVANRRVDGMASGMEMLIGLSGTQETRKYGITDENSTGFNRQPVSTRDLMRGSSFYYALDDAPQGGMDSGLNFTIWGAGDWNAFEGSPSATSSFDGTLTSGYLGIDVSKTASWIAGVAVGRTMGTSDYDVTVTDGTLEATLNSVYPYVHWSGPGCCIEVWGIGGFGTGEAEVSDGTSDLSMSLGMVGVRAQLVGTASGGLDLDLIGDAGITKLSTADSESASLSDLEASVQRVRVGLEASRTSDMGNGMLFTPFAQVAGRYDGGDGQTGNGLEIAGGLRIAGGRAGLEARGRFLAMHTGEEVKEHGVSVVAYVRPMGAGGQGLSIALAPRIGADTDMSGNIWREDPANEVTRTSRSTGAGVKAEIGYGLTTPMLSNILVTPFGQMDMAGDEQRRMRLGARFGSFGDTTSILSFELTGERIDGNGRTADHRIGLLGRMSF